MELRFDNNRGERERREGKKEKREKNGSYTNRCQETSLILYEAERVLDNTEGPRRASPLGPRDAAAASRRGQLRRQR